MMMMILICSTLLNRTSINGITTAAMHDISLSIGGMQALEWVLIANDYQFNDDSRSIDVTMKGDIIINGHDDDGSHDDDGHDDGSHDDRTSFVRSAVVIGCGSAHTAWQIAISETQRQAIYADPKWNRGDIDFK